MRSLTIIISLIFCVNSFAQSGWSLPNGVSANYEVKASAWGNGKWVMVGQSGRIYSITKASNIQIWNSGTGNDLNAVIWAGDRFVAVGANGTVVTSKDGISWEFHRIADQDNLLNVTWNSNDNVVMVVSKSCAYISKDWSKWTKHIIDADSRIASVSWGKNLGYIVGAGFNEYRSQTGTRWSTSGPTTDTVVQIQCADTSFGRLSNGQFSIKSSTGAVLKSMSASAVGWNGQQYIVSGSNASATFITVYSSAGELLDSVTNTDKVMPPIHVQHNGKEFLFIGKSGRAYLRDSTGTWKTLHIETSQTTIRTLIKDSLLAIDAKGFLSIINGNSNLETDFDSIKNLAAMIYVDTALYALTTSKVKYEIKPDFSVKRDSVPTLPSFTDIAYCHGTFMAYKVAYLSFYADTIYTSTDFSTWTKITLPSIPSGDFRQFHCDENALYILKGYDSLYYAPVATPTVFTRAKLRGVLYYGSIETDSQDSSLTYLSTDQGVYKTTNGGQSWIHDSLVSQFIYSASGPWKIGDSGSSSFSLTHGNEFIGNYLAPYVHSLLVGTHIYSYQPNGLSSISIADVQSFGNTNSLRGSTPPSPWTQVSGRIRPKADYQAVRYINGEFWVLGSGSERLRSSTGLVWQVDTMHESNWHSLNYVNGTYYGVGYNGMITSSDNGKRWSSYTSNTTELLRTVTSNDSVTIVGGNHVIRRSVDGVKWESILSNTIDIHSVVWGNNLFVAVGWGTGQNIMTSPDGITWTRLPALGADALFHIVYANNKFVAVGLAGEVVTSSNGVNWLRRTSNVNKSLVGVCWSGTQYVAVGDTGLIVTSPDGITWTQRTAGTSENLIDVAADPNGRLIAVGTNNTIISSTDGITWIPALLPYSGSLLPYRTVGGSPTQGFVIGGDGVLVHFMTPTSAYNFTYFPGQIFSSIYWDGSVFMAMYGNGIYRSPNGISWTAANVPSGLGLSSIAKNSSLYVGIASGALATSTDGITWVNKTADVDATARAENLKNVVWDGSMWVVCTQAGSLVVSADAVTWTVWRNLVGTPVNMMDYNNGEYLFVNNTSAPEKSTTDVTGTYSSIQQNMTTGAAIWDGSKYVWSEGSIYATASKVGFFDKTKGGIIENIPVIDRVWNIASSKTHYVGVGTDGLIVARNFVDSLDFNIGYTGATSSSSTMSSSSGTSSSGESSSSSTPPTKITQPSLPDINNGNAFVHNNMLFYRMNAASNVKIQIMDMSGRLIQSYQYPMQNAGGYYLPLQDLRKGMYIITIKSLETKRLIAPIK